MTPLAVRHPPSSARASARPRPQRFRGVVIRAGHLAKTIAVSVERRAWHPRVRKHVRVSKTILVHDAEERARVGDRVTIEACRPHSRRKRFRVVGQVAEGTGSS